MYYCGCLNMNQSDVVCDVSDFHPRTFCVAHSLSVVFRASPACACLTPRSWAVLASAANFHVDICPNVPHLHSVYDNLDSWTRSTLMWYAMFRVTILAFFYVLAVFLRRSTQAQLAHVWHFCREPCWHLQLKSAVIRLSTFIFHLLVILFSPKLSILMGASQKL